MTISFHPDDATLMSYAAGALGQPFAIVVASHLEGCPACRREFAAMRALGGVMLEAAPAEPVGSDAFDRLLARLQRPESEVGTPERVCAPVDLPQPLARLIGGGIGAVPWREALPGAETYRIAFPIARGAQSLRFLRAIPGREIPEHAHAGAELTMVLSGALRDGERLYQAGDVGDLDDATTHNPVVVGDEPCVCVIAEDGPPKFTSPEMQAMLSRLGL